MDLFEKKKIKKLKKKIKRIKEERKRVIINSVRHEIGKIQLVTNIIDIVVGKHKYKSYDDYNNELEELCLYEIYDIKLLDAKLTVICIDELDPLIIIDGYIIYPYLSMPMRDLLFRISDDIFQINSYTYEFSVKGKTYKFILVNTDVTKYTREFINQLNSVAEQISYLYNNTKYEYKNYPIYEYRCRALIVLLSQRYKSGTFSNVPKDIAIIIAKKVYAFRR